jgi:hypothetical protein
MSGQNGKTQALTGRMEAEMVAKVEQVRSKREEVTGADVCRCQCASGGACSRSVCSGAKEIAGPTYRDGNLIQVYLRWHLDRTDGETMESNGLPYFAKVKGNHVSLVAADLVYLENERKALTANGRTGSVHLRMMELPDNGTGYVTVNLVQEMEAGEETPLKRAAGVAMDFCAMIGKLSDEDAIKAIEVMKCGMCVQLLVLEQRKAVAHA